MVRGIHRICMRVDGSRFTDMKAAGPETIFSQPQARWAMVLQRVNSFLDRQIVTSCRARIAVACVMKRRSM